MRNTKHFETLAEGWGRAYREYAEKKMASLRAEDPTRDVWNTPVDVRDMPRFQYREEALAARIKSVLPPLGVLIVMAVVLFGAAYASFVRTDPR
jgi:hypothetical protein